MSSRAWAASAASWSISDWDRELRDSKPLRRFSRRMISLPGSTPRTSAGVTRISVPGAPSRARDDVHGAQDAFDGDGDREAAEFTGSFLEPPVAGFEEVLFQLRDELLKMPTDIGSPGVPDAVHGHGEGVAAGIGAAGDRGTDVVDQLGEDRDALVSLGHFVLERFLIAVVGSFGAFEAGELGVGFSFSIRSGLPVARAFTSL